MLSGFGQMCNDMYPSRWVHSEAFTALKILYAPLFIPPSLVPRPLTFSLCPYFFQKVLWLDAGHTGQPFQVAFCHLVACTYVSSVSLHQ